jgi:hypothetical protein
VFGRPLLNRGVRRRAVMTDSKAKKWYVAVLVVASRVDDGTEDGPLVDLQYKLIHAADHEAAYRRALELGAAAAHSYKNADAASVSWEFAGLNDLREVLDVELRDGVEVFHVLERAAPETFIHSKEELEAFWIEANKERTVADLLGG